MKNLIAAALFCVTACVLGCEADSGDIEECESIVSGPCAKLVSCCDLILSEDVDGQSPAGASCLNDQLVALNNRGGDDSAQSECDDLLDKSEYADICFACENEGEGNAETAAISSEEEQ